MVVETDCLPLLGMITDCSTPDIAMLRWIAFIKSLNLEFHHIAGRDNPMWQICYPGLDMKMKRRW